MNCQNTQNLNFEVNSLNMKVVKTTLFVLVLSVLTLKSYTQILVDGDSLFGNEWIDYDLSYHKVKLTEDGIYRLTYEALQDANIPVDQIPAADYQLYRLGQTQRIFTSTEGILSEGDFIEFYGVKNRSELDRHMFENPDEEMLNPEYSLVSDTMVYFLTWSAEGSPNRFTQINNDISNPPTPRSWYMHSEKQVLSQSHYKPLINSQGVRFSHYVEGEGFSSDQNTQHSFSIPASQHQSQGPVPFIRFRMTGNAVEHNVSIQWNGSERLALEIPAFNLARTGAPLIDSTITLSPSDVSTNNMFSATTSGSTDRIRFSVVELSYPRAFIFENSPSVHFTIDEARDGAYLEVDASTISDPIIYDLSSGDRLTGVIDQGIIKINLPPGPNTRQLILVDATSGINELTIAGATTWTRLDASNANYIIISHPDLIDESQNSYVADYAQYRQSAIGGNYQTQIIDIRQLVDQFAYGIHMHPLSIKNFVNFIDRNWTNPQYLFLIGKGLEYGQARLNEEPYEYLPVYGVPGSDNLLTSHGNSSVPRIPVGRLAVRTADQINIYLDKIKTMEDQIANAPQTIEDRGWMKRVLHYSAGTGESEKNLLFQKMQEMASVISTNDINGEVVPYRKLAQDEISGAESEKLISLINSGVILKTYFGHGGINTTQSAFSEDPEFLDNVDRYPVICALGCHTGNLFTRTLSLGESNVLAESKGGVEYVATSGLGFLNALDVFGRAWYTSMGADQYGESIGKSIQVVLQTYDLNESIGIKTLMQQLVLHGDPAYRITRAEGPDYLINENSITTNPGVVSKGSSEFQVKFEVINLGKNVNDSLTIQIVHENLNEPKREFQFKIKPKGYRNPVTYNIPIADFDVGGRNTLKINVDPQSEILEFPNNNAEQNNSIEFVFAGFDADIKPIFPKNQFVLNCPEVRLVTFSSVTRNPSNYILEVSSDTKFDGSKTQRYEQLSNGGSIVWEPKENNFTYDSTYFWRVTRDSLLNRGLPWMESNFTYRPGGDYGWQQGTSSQFLSNDIENIIYDTLTGKWTFQKYFPEVILINKLYNGANPPEYIDRGNRIGFAPFFNRNTDIQVVLYKDKPIPDLVWNDGTRPGVINSGFNTRTAEQRRDLIDFLQEVPDGYFVIIYTMVNTDSQDIKLYEWASDSINNGGVNLFNLLEKEGAEKIRFLEDSITKPYVFAYRKGDIPVAESLASSVYETIEVDILLFGLLDEGRITSEIVGPVNHWKSLDLDIMKEENDSTVVSILGVNNNQTVFIKNVDQFNDEIDISDIDANQFSRLQLVFFTSDKQDQTPSDIRRWNLSFDGLPDPTLFYPMGIIDSIDKGASINVQAPIFNASKYPTDSLLIRFSLIDESNNRFEEVIRFGSLDSFENKIVDHIILTEGFNGNSNVLVEVNPNADQPESNTNNNLISYPVFIESDRTPPVIDITFDGVRIMDGDVISPQPVIRIDIKDENTIDLISDSSAIQIFLENPDRITSEIDFGSNNISFQKAASDNNRATITWNAIFDADGVYRVKINGSDVAGNKSGNNDLEISFEVISEKSISRLVPYPNPFSDATRFAYFLTGAEPEAFKLQIMTVDGTIVREIDKLEFGQMKIGNHLSDFVWDGTDKFGDKLANGIYLYRVYTRDEEGMEYKKRLEGKLGSYFEKDLGKIVILR